MVGLPKPCLMPAASRRTSKEGQYELRLPTHARHCVGCCPSGGSLVRRCERPCLRLPSRPYLSYLGKSPENRVVSPSTITICLDRAGSLAVRRGCSQVLRSFLLLDDNFQRLQ